MLSFEEIVLIFEEIEQLLIGSLRRNLAGHGNDEKDEGFKWTAWQAEKLRSVDRFRRENKKLVQKYAPVIDSETRALMQEQFREGEELAENYIDELIGDDASLNKEPAFFGVNKDKVNNLIEDVTKLEKDCTTSALRLTDDIYRQTVSRVQLAMSTGSMTLPQALDISVKDFLDKGINSIVYRDGRRVNIADYVRMVLRTTSTRATLQGMSQRAKELGYDTVLISAYSMCSETCLPWQGRVYIDDVFSVWQGEISGERGRSLYCGKWFPLLSSAIRGGLFHPNCRHTMTVWIDGVSVLPPPLDNSKIEANYKLEQQQRALEREVRKAKRKVEGCFSPENAIQAKQELQEAQKKLREFVNEHSDVLRRDYGKEKVYDDIPKKRIDNSDESGIIEEKAKEMAETYVHKVGNIDIDVYKCVTEDIMTDEVVITDERIQHIKERHPNDYEKYFKYMKEIIETPEYIIEANKPNTALILKSFEEEGIPFKTILRLVTSSDNADFKNSIITFMKINGKEWERLIKNKKILYKSE